MRKSIIVGAGLASAAVLAVAGLATANATTASPVASQSEMVARQAGTTTQISQADAERVALAAVPGSTVTETRLDTDNGRTVWNVHLSTSNGTVEVKVDAQTGDVRIDDDDASRTGPSTGPGHGDDGPDHDAGDDHGSDDGPDHDAGDDHGRGSDDGPDHD